MELSWCFSSYLDIREIGGRQKNRPRVFLILAQPAVPVKIVISQRNRIIYKVKDWIK